MSHGTTECEPVDHTEARLFAAYERAEKIADFAAANVADAERGLVIAKLASDRATENARSAENALRKHRDAKR